MVATAKDSSRFDATGKIYELFGDAEVTYGDINLKADYIRLNYDLNEVFARGRYDSTTKKWIGQPVFQDGTDNYNTKEIRYNFKTRKGLIQSVITAQGEGNIRGPRVKKDNDGNVYIGRYMGQSPIYTTCNLATPHFHIAASKIKVIPNKQVVAGPFNLVINEVPLPIGLPFGFFPIPKQKEIGTAGIIFPSYGEEPNGRGFFLRDGGYYWPVNQNIGLQFKGSIYSNGSWGAGIQSQYVKRYRYGGNFNLAYARNRTTVVVDTTQGPKNDFAIQWSHAPQSNGNSNFSANVNISSNSYNQLNSSRVQSYISNAASSSVQYSRQLSQYLRAGANLRVNQNFGRINPNTGLRELGQTDVSSDFNIGMSQVAPFALKGGTGRWYESFRVGLDFSGQALVNNVRRTIDTTGLGFPIITNLTIRGDTLQARRDSLARIARGEFGALTTNLLPFDFNTLPTLLRQAQVGGRFSIPISLPNFKLARYINLTPGMSLQGDLYTRQLQFNYNPVFNAVQVDTLNRISAVYSMNFSASLNTRAYGTYFFRWKRLEAIRHTIAPSVSFTYTPDLSDAYAVTLSEYTGRDGRPLRVSKYRNLGGSAGGINAIGNQASISYSIVNQIEMKVRSRSDSAKSEFEKISLFDNISLSGSYNPYAPIFRFSPINLSANTQLLKTINFNFNATFDPYAYELARRPTGVYFVPDASDLLQVGDISRSSQLVRVDKLAISSKQGLAHLQNLSFFVSTRFAPKGANRPKQTPNPGSTTPAEQAQLRQINMNPDEYVDFTIPWSINVNYNFTLTKFTPIESQIIQTLQITGDLSLTPKWKINVSSGYDFSAKAPSLTTIGVNRDLHCWEMAFNWTPFAGNRFRSNFFTFDLRARSAILRDLKLTRRSRGGFMPGAF